MTHDGGIAAHPHLRPKEAERNAIDSLLSNTRWFAEKDRKEENAKGPYK
jgi:hypothetical protein